MSKITGEKNPLFVQCFTPKKKDTKETKTSPSLSTLLKQVYAFHLRKIRELNSKITHLRRQLPQTECTRQEDLESTQDNKCPNCDNNAKLLENQRIKYEKKLQEKDKIINELRYQQSSSNESNPAFTKKRRLEFPSTSDYNGRSQCERRTAVLRRPKNDSSDLLLTDPSHSVQPVTAANAGNKQQNCNLIRQSRKTKRDTMKFITSPESEPDSNSDKNVSAKFMPIPETAVDEMDNNQSELIVMETLFADLTPDSSEFPVITRDPSQIITNQTIMNAKTNGPNSPINARFSHRMPYEPDRSVIEKNSVTKNQDLMGSSMSFQKLCKTNLNKSFEEFEATSVKKLQSSPLSKAMSSGRTATYSNAVDPHKATLYPKLRLSSPSSKYKLHFEPAKKGQKMPKYKQTTLTQSLLNKTPTVESEELQRAIVESLKEDSKNVSPVKGRSDVGRNGLLILSPKSIIKNNSHEAKNRRDERIDDIELSVTKCDLDSTYVPTQLLRIANSDKNGGNEPCEVTYVSPQLLLHGNSDRNNTIETHLGVDFMQGKKTDDECILINECNSSSSEDLLQEIRKPSPRKTLHQEKTENNAAPSTSKCTRMLTVSPLKDHLLDDFDIVPIKQTSPKYKYKHGPVRQQDERRKLDGHECRECIAYFEAIELSDEDKQKRLKMCSRHREKYPVPSTPEHFWSVRFPTTQECKERGLMNNTQYRPLQRRRNRK